MSSLATRPFTGPGDDTLPDNVQALPKEAREIWVRAYNSAWDDYDPETSQQDSREGHANAIAWGAVNKNFKKVDGKWERRSYIQASFEAPVEVRRSNDGTVTWRSTISNDGVDRYATRMTTDLHEDLIRNAEGRYGMPFLTIAHFGALSKVGRATEMFRDGRRLKAEGVLFTSDEVARGLGVELTELERDLAAAAVDSALEDMKRPPKDRLVRTSIGLMRHDGGVEMEDLGVIAYTKGHLAEIALTAHPGNTRVDFAAEQRSGDMVQRITPEFMEIDAASIVGEDLAERLRERFKLITAGSRSSEDEDAIDLILRSMSLTETVPAHKARAKVSKRESPKWDGLAATEAARKQADGDWTAFRSFHATYDPDNTESPSGYGFIHHGTRAGGMVLDLAGVIAAGAVASEEARAHLGPHYEQFDRTPPWERDDDRLEDRLQTISDLCILKASGLVEEAEVERAKAQLTADYLADLELPLQDQVTNMEGVTREPDDVEAKTIILRSRFGDLEVSLERAGRRLQGKRLSQLRDAAAAMASAAEAITAVVDWAEADGDGERGYEPGDVEADAALWGHALELMPKELATRFHEAEADDSVIESLEYQERVDVVMRATFALSDIILANLDEEADIDVEARLQNVQSSLDEYGAIVNTVLIEAFGQGRSVPADNSNEMNQRTKPKDVKPAGAGAGPVNGGKGAPSGQPDLQRFDTSAAALRQIMLDGEATTEQLQEALNAVGAAVVEVRPEDEEVEGDDEQLTMRVGRIEVDLAGIAAGIEEIRGAVASGGQAPPPPESAPVPRRRSFRSGPAQGPTPSGADPAPDKDGRVTIRQAVERSSRQRFPVYP